MSSTRHPSSSSSTSADAPPYNNNIEDDECDEELTTIKGGSETPTSSTMNTDGEKCTSLNKSPSPRRFSTFSDAIFFWIYVILLVLTPVGYVCYRTFLVDRLPFEKSTNKNKRKNNNVAFNLDAWGKECSSSESSNKVFPEYARRLLSNNNNSTIFASSEIITPYLFSPSINNQIYPKQLESSASSHFFSTLQWSKRCVASCPQKFHPSSMPLQQILNNIIQLNWTEAMTENGSIQLSNYFVPFYSYRSSNDTVSAPSPPPISPKLISPVSANTHLVGNYHCVAEDWDGEPFVASNAASIARFHYVLTFSQWSTKEVSNASKWLALFCAPAALVLSFILLYSMRLMLRTVVVAIGLFLLTFGSFGALAYACMREEERLISNGGAAVAFLERFALIYRYSSMIFAFISIVVLIPCLIFFWQAGHSRSTAGGRRDSSHKPERPSSASGATASAILSGSSSANCTSRIYHGISRILSYLKISVRVVVIAPSVVMIPVLNSIIFTVFIVFGILPLWTSMVETHYNQIMNLHQPFNVSSSASSIAATFRIPSDEYDLYQIDNNSNSVNINNYDFYSNVSISGINKMMLASPVLNNNDNNISNESAIIFGHFVASTMLLVFVIMLVRSMLMTIQAALLAAPSIFWLFFSTPELPFATPISRVSSPVTSALMGSNKFSNAWKVLPGSFIWRNLLLTVEQQKKEDFELKQQYQQNGNNNNSRCNTGCIGSLRRLLSSMCCSSSCCGSDKHKRMNNNNSRANRYQVSATMRNTITNNISHNRISEARPRGSFWGTLLFISFVQTFIDDLALLAAVWMMAIRSIFLEPNASWIFSMINNIKLIERNIKQKRSSASNNNNNNNNKCPCSGSTSSSSYCGCFGSKHRFVVYFLHFLYQIFSFFVPNPTDGFIMKRLLKWSSLCDPTSVVVGLRLTDRKLPSSLEYDDEEDTDDDDGDQEGDCESSNCAGSDNNTRNPDSIMSSFRKPANFASATKLIQDGILSMRHNVDSSSSSTSCALETIIGAEILVRLVSYGIGAGAAFVCWFFLDPRIFSSSSSSTTTASTTIPPFFQFFFSQSEQQLSSELAQSQIFVPLRIVPLIVAFFIATFIAQSHISVFSSCSKSVVVAYHCFPQYSRHRHNYENNGDEEEEENESQMRDGRISERTTNLSRIGVANSIELISLFERIDGKVGVMSMKNFSPFNGSRSNCCCNASAAKEDVDSEDHEDENTPIAVSAI